jgi:sulfite dehydrogenase
MKIILFFTLGALGVATAAGEVVKIQLPLETTAYKAAPGAQLANGQCLTCHSADYAATQPLKPRDFWKAEVDKMRDKYGAPIPHDQDEDLTAYFVRNYGTGTSLRESTNTAPPQAASPAAHIDAKALALKSGCLNCHTVETKLVGPAYKDVASKYRGKPDGPDRVAHQITRGGAGQWGQIPMPPFPQFTSSEVEALTQWILSQ